MKRFDVVALGELLIDFTLHCRTSSLNHKNEIFYKLFYHENKIFNSLNNHENEILRKTRYAALDTSRQFILRAVISRSLYGHSGGCRKAPWHDCGF